MIGKDSLVKRIKDSSILIAWIGGLILIGGMSWFLSRHIRANFLMNSINQVLISMEDSRRLEAPINSGPRRSSGFKGQWFSLFEEEDRLLFFTLISDRTFLPCAAILDPNGRVKELIPLSSRGERSPNFVSPGLIRLYIRRIEGES